MTKQEAFESAHTIKIKKLTPGVLIKGKLRFQGGQAVTVKDVEKARQLDGMRGFEALFFNEDGTKIAIEVPNAKKPKGKTLKLSELLSTEKMKKKSEELKVQELPSPKVEEWSPEMNAPTLRKIYEDAMGDQLPKNAKKNDIIKALEDLA